MNSFRYQAVASSGVAVEGVIEADDRRSALQLLGQRGLFPSNLELCAAGAAASAVAVTGGTAGLEQESAAGRVKRKHITLFTREMSALLGAGIPIPQALQSLGEEEENPPLKAVILQLSDTLRRGSALSAAMAEHPKLFSNLYVSMIRVGEEAGVLPKVMEDLADLLEREDVVRGEVRAAVAYPMFVVGSGIVTVTILLTVVLPKLLGMMEDMMSVLPLPTLILLKVSSLLHRFWLPLLAGLGLAGFGLRQYLQTEAGKDAADTLKLRVPFIGPVFRSAALGRFARTLGTLVRSGVSLLPALKIVEHTIGNRILGRQVAQVAEETRSGDSLAAPLRKLGIFPRTAVQMIDVGEESGKLDEMLLKVADIEERHMRTRIQTLVSFLAPVLILIVGVMVGFIVIAILLPIFRMSRAIH